LEKGKGKGKGKGWLSLCCKACHCLLCCNTVATKAASIVAALQTQEKTGPMNSKSRFFGNQTCRSCISSETQQQQRKQTLSTSFRQHMSLSLSSDWFLVWLC
jgi:hypothetical protein